MRGGVRMGYWLRRFNVCEIRSQKNNRGCCRILYRQVADDAETTVRMRGTSLSVSVSNSHAAAQHDQRDAQHADEQFPRRLLVHSWVLAQHLLNIVEVCGNW